ncbi:MAG: hypothetical protein MJ033_04285 [Victivallaceae bacterium]|nr:hypothetical protein [Victivallaceae bacterium]
MKTNPRIKMQRFYENAMLRIKKPFFVVKQLFSVKKRKNTKNFKKKWKKHLHNSKSQRIVTSMTGAPGYNGAILKTKKGRKYHGSQVL